MHTVEQGRASKALSISPCAVLERDAQGLPSTSMLDARVDTHTLAGLLQQTIFASVLLIQPLRPEPMPLRQPTPGQTCLGSATVADQDQGPVGKCSCRAWTVRRVEWNPEEVAQCPP